MRRHVTRSHSCCQLFYLHLVMVNDPCQQLHSRSNHYLISPIMMVTPESVRGHTAETCECCVVYPAIAMRLQASQVPQGCQQRRTIFTAASYDSTSHLTSNLPGIKSLRSYYQSCATILFMTRCGMLVDTRSNQHCATLNCTPSPLSVHPGRQCKLQLCDNATEDHINTYHHMDVQYATTMCYSTSVAAKTYTHTPVQKQV